MAITAANLQTQEYRFQYDAAAGRWFWVTVMDVSGVVPAFRVERILSPYGVLRDSVPIPGEVIESMAESIEQLRTQFQPSILLLPTSLTFSVDEGRGFSEPLSVTLTNNGVFGSLLGANLVGSAAYLTVTPEQVGNLAFSESGTFEVSVDSSELLAINSPVAASVTISDTQATNNPQTLSVTIVVRPKAEISTDPENLIFNAIKPLTGAFDPVPSQTFTIENTGPAGSVLEWQIEQLGCEAWLQSFFPISGTLNSGEEAVITVAVVPPVSTMVGTYTETLRVSGYSQNQFVDVTVQLVVT